MTGEPSVAGELRILTPGLTEEEIAAVTAVVALTVEELLDEQVPAEDPAPSRWRRGPGSLRGDVGALRGAWGQSLR